MTARIDILEVREHKRAYDGKVEVIGRIKDYDNSYTYVTETGQQVTFTPEKWITLKVKDNGPIGAKT